MNLVKVTGSRGFDYIPVRLNYILSSINIVQSGLFDFTKAHTSTVRMLFYSSVWHVIIIIIIIIIAI
uniref:Proton_antipo_M domain-containing protein n=1 Tax=Heterorhabditis bacteriophora TaxID=37862 RepID=A0A1I7WBK5_HETBA